MRDRKAARGVAGSSADSLAGYPWVWSDGTATHPTPLIAARAAPPSHRASRRAHGGVVVVVVLPSPYDHDHVGRVRPPDRGRPRTPRLRPTTATDLPSARRRRRRAPDCSGPDATPRGKNRGKKGGRRGPREAYPTWRRRGRPFGVPCPPCSRGWTSRQRMKRWSWSSLGYWWWWWWWWWW